MSWRDAMHPRQSRMEIELLHDLNLRGYFPVTDYPFCLLETRPDQYYQEYKKAVYIDLMKIHEKRRERDMELRRLLTKRHGVHVLTCEYKRYSPKAQRRLLAEILEWLN